MPISISYAPLFQTLSHKKLKLADIQRNTNITRPTLSKFSKNKPVSLEIILEVAKYLSCNIEDIVTFEDLEHSLTVESSENAFLIVTQTGRKIGKILFDENKLNFTINN